MAQSKFRPLAASCRIANMTASRRSTTAQRSRGCAAVNVSSGGSSPVAQIPIGPGYPVSLARAVKQATSMPVIAVGLITEYEQAESILANGDADLIALWRAVLYDPRWPWHAAA